MGMLSSFFNPGKAYEKAGEQLGNFYNESQGYLQPFMNQGQDAYMPLSDAMKSLLNPEQLHSQWASGYRTSPYAQHLQDAAQQQGLNAASSMGLMGSTPALQAIQAGTSQIGMQDRDNYLNNIMQKYMSGAQLAQGIYGQGAQAGNQMSQNAMSHGNNMAQMTYGKNAASGQLLGNLVGMGAGLAGTALAGPIGGALANKFIGSWGAGG